ncbi:MAG: GNAT family N-acetyltransferase [Deltaproteobacteria bacterium]|nr:MAG: GNAT family N-acetyltransferase [Deltaproteobacteria bacterium]
MIEYRETQEVDLDQLVALIRAAGWNRGDDPARLEKQLAGARYVVSAWDGARLVGFARAISDGVTNAYVSTVAVLPGYPGRGIGREMIARLLAGKGGISFVLHARPEVRAFYEKCGLSEAPDMMWRRRSV